MAVVKVMSAGAMASMVEAIGEEFGHASGNTLDLHLGTAGATRGKIEAGEKADLVILPTPAIEALEQACLVVAGSKAGLGRTLSGVAIRTGGKAPDLSSVEAFRQALLNAKTVAFVDPAAGGSSGTNFVKNLQRLGIEKEIYAKAVLGKRGTFVAESVADGRAEFGLTFTSEMMPVPGVEIVGFLPGDLAFSMTYTAAVPTAADNPEGGRALLKALTDTAGRARWTEAGIEPLF